VYSIVVQASSPIVAIALRTALSCRAVMEKRALPERGGDHVVAVVGRVRPQHHGPGCA